MASYEIPRKGSRSPHAGSSRDAKTSGFTRPYSKRGATGKAWGTQGQGHMHGQGRGGSQSSYNVVRAGPRLGHSSSSQLRSKQFKIHTDSSNMDEPSTEIQARMAAISKSGERHRERISGSESEEEEEDMEYNELLRSTLKMYYQDLNVAAGDDGRISHGYWINHSRAKRHRLGFILVTLCPSLCTMCLMVVSLSR